MTIKKAAQKGVSKVRIGEKQLGMPSKFHAYGRWRAVHKAVKTLKNGEAIPVTLGTDEEVRSLQLNLYSTRTGPRVTTRRDGRTLWILKTKAEGGANG